MENYIIIGMIAVIVVIAVISSIKHFKGEGGCCGGGSYKPKRKKLSGIKYTKKFKVGGMSCEHCKAGVEEAVNDIKGARGRVNLKREELTVSYAEEVDDEIIKAKLDRIGYTVTV